MTSVGAFTVRWDRDAHNVGGRAILWTYDEGDMRESLVKRRGRLVCATGPASVPQSIEMAHSGTIPIRSSCRTRQNT